MSDLRLFNTLGRRLETFAPMQAGEACLYTCGPTVYDEPHIGNLRTFVFEDLLRRTLELFGYRVVQVMNLTDVEDKIIAKARERGLSIDELTAPYIDAFFRDLSLLGIARAEHYPRATAFVPQMIEMIGALVRSGHAYEVDGSVFFHVARFPAYGRLSGIDLCQVRQGERVADDEYGKDDVRDFVLWKATKPGEPSWESPWGPGRPGWHIECSAMSRALLGDTLDIHCGGVDNIFPHHENEIAQSECFSGHPFVHYWLHSEHLLVDGEKMSKSLGNQYRLSDLLERGADPRAVRYALVSVHYRQRLNFTAESLEHASSALRRLDEMKFRLDHAPLLATVPESGDLVTRSAAAVAGVREQLGDDLNVSGALGELFGLVKEVNRRVEGGVTAGEREAVRASLCTIDSVLQVLDAEAWRQRALGVTPAATSGAGPCDQEIESLVARRTAARQGRDFASADRIREQLSELGIVLEDTSGGTLWRRR
ncbi:MAG TPA: cysteine--tRNA ligase [Thermoanaerobaculia bacterium]|nr:cysteine--tRNA ligase [Thermoanaerobaculia bacterium]